MRLVMFLLVFIAVLMAREAVKDQSLATPQYLLATDVSQAESLSGRHALTRGRL